MQKLLKGIGIIVLLSLTACSDQEVEQKIVPEAQLKALQKAKSIEKNLLEAQQKRENEYEEQGL